MNRWTKSRWHTGKLSLHDEECRIIADFTPRADPRHFVDDVTSKEAVDALRLCQLAPDLYRAVRFAVDNPDFDKATLVAMAQDVLDLIDKPRGVRTTAAISKARGEKL